jgi:hypothetical protein
MNNTDLILNGTTYRNLQIKFTPTRLGCMYETAAPGQRFATNLQGLPHQTFDECMTYAKESIDNFLEFREH